jgi:hypothetical protein
MPNGSCQITETLELPAKRLSGSLTEYSYESVETPDSFLILIRELSERLDLEKLNEEQLRD